MTRFGRRLLDLWALDPSLAYLNHGTVGAPPRRVLAFQQAIRDEIERQPARFLLRELTGVRVGLPDGRTPRLREAAAEVADFLGVRGEDLVFVDNATTGANAVLGSVPLGPDDEILVTDLGYGGVTNAARFVARLSGARLTSVTTPDPGAAPGDFVDAIAAALGPRTRLAIVDHVASSTALLLPIAEIAAACRARGVPLLVDGAHGPGALDLDLDALGVDWYVGNLHKWAWSPRSSAVLWVDASRRERLHPTVISWGLDQGLAHEFDLVGTRDPSPHLAAPEGLRMLRELGLDAIRAYNHDLAWRGGRELAARWGTELAVPESMVGCMVSVPLPPRFEATDERAARLRDELLFEDGVEVNVYARRGRLWARVAVQVYNDEADLARLGRAIERR
jgi:isopenicillin-N epimerase